MTDKEKLNAIRAEVEKYIDAARKAHTNITEGNFAHLLSFINSLQEEPISEPSKELAETYLDVFDKKFPILPTLKGKELTDYKNFLNKCQQIFGLKHWGIYPTQAKLFEKFSLLWAAWGAEHLRELGKYNKEEQDITVNEDLEKAAIEAFKQIVDADKNNFLEIFKAGAKWKEEQMMKDAIDAKIGSRVEGIIYNIDFNIDSNLEPNDKVKVIIIKNE